MKKEVDFNREYMEHRCEILDAVDNVLQSGRYILGSEVAKFEEAFARYTNKKYCITVGNGYDALYLSYKALGIDWGSKVGVFNELHVSTTNAALACGAKVVHLSRWALPCDVWVYVHDPMHPIGKEILASAPVNAYVLEDACQVIGSKCDYGFGIAQCWSFHPLKVLHCYGDGGAITTNCIELYKKLYEMRNHGRIGKSDKYNWGVNSRLDEVQAAVLNVMLKYI